MAPSFIYMMSARCFLNRTGHWPGRLAINTQMDRPGP